MDLREHDNNRGTAQSKRKTKEMKKKRKTMRKSERALGRGGEERERDLHQGTVKTNGFGMHMRQLKSYPSTSLSFSHLRSETWTQWTIGAARVKVYLSAIPFFRMVRWCIRLMRLTLVWKVRRYRLVQVRQNLKKISLRRRRLPDPCKHISDVHGRITVR